MKKRQPIYALSPSENAIMCARHQIEDERMAAFDNFFDKVAADELITAQDMIGLKLDHKGIVRLHEFMKKRGLA